MNASPIEHAGVATETFAPVLDVHIAEDGTFFLSGEVDMSNRRILDAAFRKVPVTCSLRIDMSNVTFIDSSGLGVLIAAFLARDGRVRVVNPSSVVERLLRITWQYDRFVGTEQ